MAKDLDPNENPGVNGKQTEAVENLKNVSNKQSVECGDSDKHKTSETQEAGVVNSHEREAKGERRDSSEPKSEAKSEPTGATNLAGFSVEKFKALEEKCEKFEALEKVVNALVSAFELAKNSGFGTLDASAFQKSEFDGREVKRLEAELDEEKERRQKAENDLKEIKDKVNEVQKNFDNSEINKKDFESKFEKEQKASKQLKEEKERLESEKSQLESDLKNKERELKETKNELNGKISNLESEKSQLESDLKDTKEKAIKKIEELNKNNDKLTEDLAAERANVNNLENEVSELKGECTKLENKLDKTEENLSKAENELETANKKVAQMRRDFGLDVFEVYKRLPAEFRESFGFIDGTSAATFLVTCVTRNTVVNLYENVKNRILRNFEYVEVAKFFDEVFGLAEGIFEFERLLPQVGDAFNSNKEDAINLSRTSRGEIQEVVFCGFRDGKKIYESIVRT